MLDGLIDDGLRGWKVGGGAGEMEPEGYGLLSLAMQLRQPSDPALRARGGAAEHKQSA